MLGEYSICLKPIWIEWKIDEMDKDGNLIEVELTSYGNKYTIWYKHNDVNTNPNEPV